MDTNEVPPGGEANLTVAFKTGGYGGRNLFKKTKVTTNDPDQPVLMLTVTGPVERKTKVTPSALYLNGKPGEVLDAMVTIMPTAKNPLSITGIVQRPNSGLLVDLHEPEQPTDPWQVKISVSSDKPSHVYETVTLKTDNEKEPKIFIKVSASFRKDS